MTPFREHAARIERLAEVVVSQRDPETGEPLSDGLRPLFVLWRAEDEFEAWLAAELAACERSSLTAVRQLVSQYRQAIEDLAETPARELPSYFEKYAALAD